ncbi:MAG: PRTRC system protein C [Terrimonas sp.]|nr:PRTRC system protein C [Terrimonas sp.]OJY97971.1 MAG: PRTRC system protein C [Sphingobacteriales bacterium 40-81]
MLTSTILDRTFLFKQDGQEIKLSDPSDKLSVEAVLNFYANTYPVLTTAKIIGPEIKDDTVQYRFETVMGTKG